MYYYSPSWFTEKTSTSLQFFLEFVYTKCNGKLTHSFLMQPFSTLRKHQKTVRYKALLFNFSKKFPKRNHIFMTKKDWRFCDQVSQVIAILDKSGKFSSSIALFLGCDFPTLTDSLNLFKYLRSYSGPKN